MYSCYYPPQTIFNITQIVAEEVDTFHNQIREWAKLEQFHGPDINKSRIANKS